MDMQSGKWICMDTLMDNSMDNAKISFLDIKCGYIGDLSWICWISMDMYVYPRWISNPVQQVGYVPLEATIYLWISIHIHRYP